MDTSPAQIGPFLDYSARLEFLRFRMEALAANCTAAVAAGNFEHAGYFAQEWAPLAAARDRLNARYDSMDKDAPDRWIGWDVQNGWEAPAAPELPAHCDSEHGVADCFTADGQEYQLEYTSWCSLSGHDVAHATVTEACACGCGDPALHHPCIGHDPVSGLPLVGPSKFWHHWSERIRLQAW
jgi:hypothetical protein